MNRDPVVDCSRNSRVSKLPIILLVVGFFLLSIGQSCLNPFYPVIAIQKGMSNTLYGLMVTTFFVPQIFLIFIWERMILKFRPISLYKIGSCCAAISLLSLSFVDKINSKNLFIASSFGLAFIYGIGFALITSVSNYITIEYMPNVSSTIALMEMGSGMGYCLGPFVGGLMYDKINFGAPMKAISLLFFLLSPFSHVVFKYLPNIDDTRHVPSIDANSQSAKLLRISAIWVLIFATMIPFILICFFDLFFSIYCNETLGKSSFVVGIGLLIISGFYGASAAILGFFLTKWNMERTMVFVGSVINSAISITIAVLGYMDKQQGFVFWTAIISLINVATQLMYVPCFTLMDQVAINKGFMRNQQLSSSLSNIFTTALTMGQLLGNGISGIVFDHIGISNISIVFSIITTALGLGIVIFIQEVPSNEKTALLSNSIDKSKLIE